MDPNSKWEKCYHCFDTSTHHPITQLAGWLHPWLIDKERLKIFLAPWTYSEFHFEMWGEECTKLEGTDDETWFLRDENGIYDPNLIPSPWKRSLVIWILSLLSWWSQRAEVAEVIQFNMTWASTTQWHHIIAILLLVRVVGSYWFLNHAAMVFDNHIIIIFAHVSDGSEWCWYITPA